MSEPAMLRPTTEQIATVRRLLAEAPIPAGPQHAALTREWLRFCGATRAWMDQYAPGATATLRDGSTVLFLD